MPQREVRHPVRREASVRTPPARQEPASTPEREVPPAAVETPAATPPGPDIPIPAPRPAPSFANRPRLRFEAPLGSNQEIAPGVILHLTRLDEPNQRLEGKLVLPAESRPVWLTNRRALEAIPFYLGTPPKRYDLIVTGLKATGATGYVILP